MNDISLGPLVMDASRLAFVAAVVVFVLIADHWRPHAAHRWSFRVLIAWVIGARLGFVAANAGSFAANPWDVLKLWQGGFSLLVGTVAAALVIGVAALRTRRAALPLIAGAGGAAAVFLALGSVLTGAAPDRPTGTFEALRGPDIVLEDIDRPLVLNLWATWCPPCRREMPMMLDVAAQTEAVQFVFANQGESVAQIGRFLGAGGLGADHIVLDPANGADGHAGCRRSARDAGFRWRRHPCGRPYRRDIPRRAGARDA
ncbi:TlpA disulfide reductase family protein [Pelagivirga sediminicola]|nr:TlpA disulfide reductase family protein [Pelagivirga sediminicola]